MSKIAIMTDSNSGITQDNAKKLGVTVVPMPFFIDGEEYLEDITLTQEKFYEKLLSGANVSTSQPSIGYITSIWDELLKENDAVIYIPMSSGLSKSCASATLASQADEYKDKVFVIDNKRISVTMLSSALEAKRMAEKGYSAKEIADKLMEYADKSDIFIMVDTLEYLKKGGRITATAAALGGLLKLKPILIIEGDKLDKYRMRNRTVENAKEIMIGGIRGFITGYLKDINGKTDDVEVYTVYSGTDSAEVEKFTVEVNEAVKDLGLSVTGTYPLSLSVSCHIGNGALAIAIAKKMDF